MVFTRSLREFAYTSIGVHVFAECGTNISRSTLRKGNAVRSVGGINVCGDGVDFSPDGQQRLHSVSFLVEEPAFVTLEK